MRMTTIFLALAAACLMWYFTYVLMAVAMLSSGKFKRVRVGLAPLWLATFFAVAGVLTR